MEWVRVADPNVGRVDDLQIASTVRVDGYQVKWQQYGGTVTLRDLVRCTNKEPSLIAQLVDGWRRLQVLYPHHRVVVHLVTNAHPSPARKAWMPEVIVPPTPYHLAAFIEQEWHPTQLSGRLNPGGEWAAVWESIRLAGGLSPDELSMFVLDCSLDFQAALPEDNADLLALNDLLFATAAGAERIIALSRGDLLARLGWTHRYTYRSVHEFPAPPFLYRPIRSTVEAVETMLEELPGGYVGVFGPPGSGKSTLLTRTLRALPLRLVRYYAYVPDAQDPSVLRGESTNFLHDVTLRLQEAGAGQGKRPDPSDRAAMLDIFHEQLQAVGEDYAETGMKTVILVDGLDHIEREQDPERSLLSDLPLPEAIPDGVYFVMGSQTDRLSHLPPRVYYALGQKDRRIEMGRLGPSDVHAIAEHAVPSLNADERQRVFELSNGHPLALVYLLKRLRQSKEQEERTRVLKEAIAYKGDIEAQYWAHWRAIEDDDALVQALGLLARVRGPIPMTWLAGWLDTVALQNIQRLFLQYFEEEGQDHWVFFHNSFRLFLVERTAEPLPGQTSGHQNQTYHRELAERYEASSAPWQWEALYHRYSAGEYAAVMAMATPEWFREQAEALRPLDAVQTDARLALQAAGVCRDVVALARLTLTGAALEQRSWTLKDCSLPDLLLEAGEAVRAAEHLRDGNRLRVGAEQALRVSARLSEAGLEREGRRVFELAEPLELLSGRTILDDHTRPQNLWELLRAWVQSAIVFRGPEEVVQVVRRIRSEPEPSEGGDVKQVSRKLQNWLLFQGALACCERGEWVGWQTSFDALNEEQDRLVRFYTLLRSAERTQEAGDANRARALLLESLGTVKPGELAVVDDQRRGTEARLAVAELALLVVDDEAVARAWAGDLPPVPLRDRSLLDERGPSLQELRFRSGRLRYLFGEARTPEALLRETEAHIEFSDYTEEEEEKAGRRQIALAVLHLARLWAWGHLGRCLESAAFLQEVRWILDLLGPGWMTQAMPFRRAVAGARGDVLGYIVTAAAEHGEEVLAALRDEFEARWTDPSEGSAWGIEIQRELVIALAEVGTIRGWAEAQLNRIEPIIMHGLDPFSRVEACEEQAKAWLALRNQEAARAQLGRMVRAATGILSDKDYQLPMWVNWLGRISELEPEQAKERIRLMLRRILSVQGSASGIGDAAEELLGVVFRWSPRRAVGLLKGLLEHHIVDHQGGVSRLLEEALDAQEPSVSEVLYTVVDLVLPLVPGTEPNLIESLILRASDQFGSDAAFDTARCLVGRIGNDALANRRAAWYRGVVAGFRAIGGIPGQLGLQSSDLEDRTEYGASELDRNLYLQNGESLDPEEVLAQVRTVGDLRALLKDEDREHSQYFDWPAVGEHLVPGLATATELEGIQNAVQVRLAGDQLSRSLAALSKRFLELGDRAPAWTLAEQALAATNASGWDPYWDGGVRHAVLQQLIAVDGDRAREQAIELYARDLSERFRYPGRVVLHLYDVLALLSERVPVTEIWPAIEAYLDELFASIPAEPQAELERLLEEPVSAPREDTSARAIADLLTLYLDHPSFPVAQGAVRACTAALLGGSDAIIAALEQALNRTDEAIERALMVLDAASLEDPKTVVSFNQVLEELNSSPNFAIRLIASVVLARVRGKSPILLVVEREAPAIYQLHLPTIALQRTERVAEGQSQPVAIDDPARALSPMDIEARAIAEAANLPEDNVLYQAGQYLRALEVPRTWLQDGNALGPRRLSAFLDQIGLRVTHNRPHIAPARCALAHVMAELYDGGYLVPEAVQRMSEIIVRHDPKFILRRPERRPSWIEHIGGIPVDYHSFIHLPERWVEAAKDSLSLLYPRTPDDRVVLGEWTRLRYLHEEWPEEDRMAVVRLVGADELWQGLDVAEGHPPFARWRGVQVARYMDLEVPPDHVIIAHAGYHPVETPGACWLALNPALGRALGWHPIHGGWLRWADEKGAPVVESFWWGDGPVHQYTKHLNVEVGSGWLVLVTKPGFEAINQWASQLSRGGVVIRSKGWHGDAGRTQAVGVLPLA